MPRSMRATDQEQNQEECCHLNLAEGPTRGAGQNPQMLVG